MNICGIRRTPYEFDDSIRDAENVRIFRIIVRLIISIKSLCVKNFGIESPFTETEFKTGKEDELTQRLFEASEQHYRLKAAEIAEMTFPVIDMPLPAEYMSPLSLAGAQVVPFHLST